MEQTAINLWYNIKNQGNYPKFILYYQNEVVGEFFRLSTFAIAIETEMYDKIEVKEY